MDKTAARTTLFDSLEKEFCPTLDSSLIAALLVEIESDISGDAVTPTQDQIEFLRTTLRELSLQAEESQQSELSDVQLTSQFEETISSWTTPDNGFETNGTGSSLSSISSLQSFGSPLGFLQAALPDIPTRTLAQALEDAGEDVDMWGIIANILTEESIREMEERGIEGLEEEEEYLKGIEITGDWETVDKRKKTPGKAPKKKAQPRPKKVALADIRQQHHVIQPSLRKNGTSGAADPWTQIASLSDHLATLLSPHPPSVFQSFFHSPQYATSYDALRAALTSLSKGKDESDEHVAVLYNLLDVIMPEYEDSDVEQRARLISDIELSVLVTEGKGDESLDLINLLRELDSNSDIGLYHLQPPEPSKPTKGSPIKQVTVKHPLPSAPPPIEPPPPWKVKQKPPASPTTRNKPSPYQWQIVPQRKHPDRGPHPLAPYIPAYSKDVNGMKTPRSNGKGTKAAGNGDASGLHFYSVEFRRRMTETMRRRDEALREAARMWQRGNSKSRGGEIAFYFAERAREFQELARQEALNAARVMVQEKRINSQKHDTIDLHGTTVAEALVIVKEIIKDESSAINNG
ncbi:hypothetical protein CPB84DRAFT_659842 [Gymnopilus junonius]|uniref:DUF1771 domain-containing protein n=1 Tax=Gymnopilus junonius TaxID=109634 RepID=A0A9P5TFY2_GYMJU|nr:hypothetical protein CPB84DRAFT_659842 [Gymnopilus junonius]